MRIPSLRSIVRSVAITATAALIATAATLAANTGDSYALWNSSVRVADAQIVVAGKPVLAVRPGTQPAALGSVTAPLAADAWTKLLPGENVGVDVTVTNYGEGAAKLMASIDATTAAYPHLSFRLAEGTCAGIEPSGAQLTTTPQSVLSARIPSNESATFCLQAELSKQTPAAEASKQLISAFKLTLSA